ncbi:unnamed protein product [Chrysodeixis includens]|uniref:Uncharacterized protein n=1 Tax=Chrysodeixis includens TaxID=689277 RepID=A0A9P0FRJ8_CHRIL|nr:unnamed protein product [Chrysodeixis includens]
MTAIPYENVYPKTDLGCSFFTKCCFCIPLKTGCFVLGYISLVLNFVISMFFIGTLVFLGIYTHGFRYIRYKLDEDGEQIPDEDSLDRTKFNLTIIVILLVACLNVGWLVMNVVLLIGLHRKKPGHIKTHVTVASMRLILSMVGVLLYGAHTFNSMVFCYAEIGLSAYFILLYYRYALQLERELKLADTPQVSDVVCNTVFSYPKTIDKTNLTEKDDKIVYA